MKPSIVFTSDLKDFGILTISFLVVTKIDLCLFAISAKLSKSFSL